MAELRSVGGTRWALSNAHHPDYHFYFLEVIEDIKIALVGGFLFVKNLNDLQ